VSERTDRIVVVTILVILVIVGLRLIRVPMLWYVLGFLNVAAGNWVPGLISLAIGGVLHSARQSSRV
jgi:hypothetical protein